MQSGKACCALYPASARLEDLAEPFRDAAVRFVGDLRAAGATVAIACTLRPPERAFLMHWAWLVAREGLDVALVPQLAGLDIEWTLEGAKEMVAGYGIVYQPVLASRHTEGNAVDMNIVWEGELALPSSAIASEPRSGARNLELHAAAAARYGVHKLLGDPPHWSVDGR